MSFGNALWKFLASIALLASTGLKADDLRLYDLYKLYEQKVDVCLSQTNGISALLLKQPWLLEVDDNQLKEVIVYFSRYALDQCSSKEQDSFERALNNESLSSQKIILEWLEFDVQLEPPKWLDSEKLREIQSNDISPFNPIETYKHIKQSK
ncbi:hypothetical protein [Vibrio intestinalis]|uniref:hypothetical protein n=1 Tax=Vibrio intestinalis TaxID=2933291 RepID=UPI0021A41522|nr:hypothetical protein [Vibrio intestinalis]